MHTLRTDDEGEENEVPIEKEDLDNFDIFVGGPNHGENERFQSRA
jgi:hypothetical protein